MEAGLSEDSRFWRTDSFQDLQCAVWIWEEQLSCLKGAAQLELGFKQQFEKSSMDWVGYAPQSELKEDADQTSTGQERTETRVSNI